MIGNYSWRQFGSDGCNVPPKSLVFCLQICRVFSSFSRHLVVILVVPFLFFWSIWNVLDFSFQFARLVVDAFDSVANAKVFLLALADFCM